MVIERWEWELGDGLGWVWVWCLMQLLVGPIGQRIICISVASSYTPKNMYKQCGNAINLSLFLYVFYSQKFTTFSTVTLSLFVGLVILSEYPPEWLWFAYAKWLIHCIIIIIILNFNHDYRYYLAVTRLGSAWHVAHATIIAPYKAFSREKLPARIGTHIGLMHVNVTLTGELTANYKLLYYYYILVAIWEVFLVLYTVIK